MFPWRHKAGGPIRHLGDDELLLYFDGELAGKAAEGARQHLQQCWDCSARLKLLEDSIACFMRERNADLDRFPAPPQASAQFMRRLSDLAARTRSRSSWRTALPMPGRPWIIAAVLATLAVVAVLRLGDRNAATVSAKDILWQAEQVESASLGRVDSPVVYRKLSLRRRSDSATFELWSDRRHARLRQRGDAQAWRELEHIYRTNGFAGGEPLSPAAFLTWRNSLPEKRDEVTRGKLADGSDSIRLRTAAVGRKGAEMVHSATLVIRARDWHPVAQELSLGAPEAASQYELTEIAYSVVPLSTVEASVFEPPPAPRAVAPQLAAAIPLEAPRTQPPTVSLDDVEVEVRYVLHRLGACKGEEIVVDRSPSGAVRVKGVVDTPARRLELRTALAEQASVDLDLRTVEELAAAVPTQDVSTTATPSFSVRGRTVPIEEELKRYFASPAESDGGLAASVRFSNRALATSQAMMTEAWALRRLAEGYGSRSGRLLRPFSLSLLTQMAADHERQLALHAEAMRHQTAPALAAIFGLSGGPAASRSAGEWSERAMEEFTIVRRVAALARSLFSASAGDDVPRHAAARELLDRLQEIPTFAAERLPDAAAQEKR